MPDLEVTDLEQFAVLWPFSGYDRYGQPTVGAPTQIPVRWLTKRREVLDGKGNTIALDATAVVDRLVPMDSHIWLGKLKDWYASGSAGVPDELMSVKVFNGTPDIKNRNVRQELGLMRLHDKQNG